MSVSGAQDPVSFDNSSRIIPNSTITDVPHRGCCQPFWAPIPSSSNGIFNREGFETLGFSWSDLFKKVCSITSFVLFIVLIFLSDKDRQEYSLPLKLFIASAPSLVILSAHAYNFDISVVKKLLFTIPAGVTYVFSPRFMLHLFNAAVFVFIIFVCWKGLQQIRNQKKALLKAF